MKLLKLLKRFAKKIDERIYQVKKGNQSEWTTLDELIKRNKENHFYQNLLGARHESIERHFKRTGRETETSQILSVSNLHSRK